MINGLPGVPRLLDALGDFGRRGLQTDQLFGHGAKLFAGLMSAPAPPVAQFAQPPGAGLQAFLNGRHLRPAQADIVLEAIAGLLLKFCGVLRFAVFGSGFNLADQCLQFLPFLITLLKLALQSGAELVKQLIEMALHLVSQQRRFGTIQTFPALPQVLDLGVVNFTGLLQQGFRLLQHFTPPISTAVAMLHDARLLLNILHQLLKPGVQPPHFSILGRAELHPGCGGIVSGMVNCRLKFGVCLGGLA